MSAHTQGKSRHWRRIVSAVMLTGASALVFATWPTAANADPAVRVGWWNTASGGGQAAPDPTAPDGGLHIAVAPGQILAYGAVLYNLAPNDTATLELKLSGQGTPVLEACPTKDVSWKEGGDQQSDAAPAYDCSVHSYTGSISSDGTTATFLVDGGADTAPGQLSLAILPYMTHDAPGGVGTELPVDSTVPFSVDISKPDVDSLTVTSLPTVPVSKGNGGGSHGGGTQQSTSSQSSGAGSSTSSGTGSPSTPTVTVPDTNQVNGSTDTGTTPQIAPPTNATTQTPMQPAAAGATPAGGSTTAHNAALALLVLVAMLVVASSTPTMQRAPRLLGGTARHAAAATGATAAAAAAPAVPMTLLGVRGLGRFAKPRNDVPRPLV
jgi:hypothetical protein